MSGDLMGSIKPAGSPLMTSCRFIFMRRPRHGNQLLTQHLGRAASRRKSRLLLDFKKLFRFCAFGLPFKKLSRSYIFLLLVLQHLKNMFQFFLIFQPEFFHNPSLLVRYRLRGRQKSIFLSHHDPKHGFFRS